MTNPPDIPTVGAATERRVYALEQEVRSITQHLKDLDGKDQPEPGDADDGPWNFKVPHGPITIYPSADDPWSPWPPPKENAMTHLEHLDVEITDSTYRTIVALVAAHNALVDVVNTMNDLVDVTGTLEDTLDTTIELSSAGIHTLHWIPTNEGGSPGWGIAACDCGWYSDPETVPVALDAYRAHLPEAESETTE